MIYDQPSVSAPVDQGDLIDQCPLVRISALEPDPRQPHVNVDWRRIVVLTQACDLANAKTVDANVAEIFDAQLLVERGTVKASEIKGPIRSARVWGWYFLPACADLGLGEMLVDLRRLHTIQLTFLTSMCRQGQRPARVRSPYREHLAKHFADTFSRIGLPQPYETM